MNPFEDVKEFHKKFQLPIRTKPTVPSFEEQTLRFSLTQEESLELTSALFEMDLEKIADGLADLIYVLIGLALHYGINLEEVWKEVHRTNMNKVGGGTRKDGKILKPEGWEPPNIKAALGITKEEK